MDSLGPLYKIRNAYKFFKGIYGGYGDMLDSIKYGVYTFIVCFNSTN